jgi:hypothetical protein
MVQGAVGENQTDAHPFLKRKQEQGSQAVTVSPHAPLAFLHLIP